MRGFQNAEGKGIGADKQAIALVITIAMALASGTLAGILMSAPLKMIGVFVPDTEFFNDALFFGEAEDYLDAVTAHHQEGSDGFAPIKEALSVAESNEPVYKEVEI